MTAENNINDPDKDKLLDHNYDGIQELDNPLPAWWVWLFYATIIFSLFYYLYYSFVAPTSAEKIDAMQEQTETLKDNVSMQGVDSRFEGELILPAGPEATALGKSVYMSRCLACHGASGEGLVGPNLTDKYWIHGGTPMDIYRVIVKGVPAKGMISWEPVLSDDEIKAVTLYMLSFQGTNPANGKAPEGELVG